MNTTTMRKTTLPLRHARAPSPLPDSTPQQSKPVPTIRLISATPSAAGSSEANSSVSTTSANSNVANTSHISNTSHASIDSSWTTVPSNPSPLAPKPETARKRLVPKKSKLGLLGGGKEKSVRDDFSDVARRVGSSSTGRGGFEIHVDSTIDPDLGDIVMVKKKKSRAALDGLRWGALGEVTNVPSTKKEKEAAPKKDGLRVKSEEKEKWWSIGRGRKDSKDKAKEEKAKADADEKSRSKVLPPPIDTRTRFNSLDSGILLTTPGNPAHNYKRSFSAGNTLQVQSDHEQLPVPRSATPTIGGMLAPPGAAPPTEKNSVAVRAMRSVRSLARIGSWAQLKNGLEEDVEPTPALPKKEKEKKKDGTEKKKKKTKKKETTTERPQTGGRYSSSSFEAGALTASPEAGHSLGQRKRSVLGIGLGLPSSMRLPTVRGGSTASSVAATKPNPNNRLSVESVAAKVIGRDRAASTISTASSLRPHSVASSGISGVSSGSSGVSVRWDEEKLETVKERRKIEREIKRESIESEQSTRRAKGDKESRRSSESRRRTPLTSIFPESHPHENPILTIEEATSDGHGGYEEEPSQDADVSIETPVKRARARPVSEQMLGRSRPQGFYEEKDEGGVLSMLDAATNDLALLINRLDLEATPGTPDQTPLKPSSPSAHGAGDESPLKKKSPPNGLRALGGSITSLRPYAQSRSRSSPLTSELQPSSAANAIGQQIAPWPTLNGFISPVKLAAKASKNALTSGMTPKPVVPSYLTHKRTLSPAPASEASPILQPLRPSKMRQPSEVFKAETESPQVSTPLLAKPLHGSPSSQTFGSRTSRAESPFEQESPSPVFKKAHGHTRKRSSLIPLEHQHSQASIRRDSLPMPPEARLALGLAGTMGGSSGSGHAGNAEASEPDSDIPNELQAILSGGSDDEYTGPLARGNDARPSPGTPPSEPSPPTAPSSPGEEPVNIPIFRAQVIDDDDNHADIDEGGSSSEDDTNKSFDFTGELQKLNESGGSDRRSFVEQLENAFRTPAKIDLRYDLGEHAHDDLLSVGVPPVPKLPPMQDLEEQSSTKEMDLPTRSSREAFSSITRIIDVSMPSGIGASESSEDVEGQQAILPPRRSRRELKDKSSMGSRPSDGQLNTDFKFGGRPTPPEDTSQPKEEAPPMTLSDIIPPLSHSRSPSSSSMVEEDSSLLKSIYAKASEIEPPAARPRPPRPRLDSDSSSKRMGRRISTNSRIRHSRNSSAMSFVGFESFAEVRRGFEFHDNRPAFYPPTASSNGSRARHNRNESLFSIASVSSYGSVVHPGSTDPFDYGMPKLSERPISDDMSISMSMTVDDTFDFINRNKRRQRVDSDASSFYFHAPAPSQIQSYNRGHRRHESAMSTASMAAPPISLYNRSYGGHRRNDSNSSASSVAQSYAMYGAGGGRAAWARHKQDASVDSIMSDYSAIRLGRPGVGDKMFDSGLDRGMPLTSISASPPESVASGRFGNRASYDYDSIMDEERRSSVEDSLFDKTGHRSSVSSSSVFGDNEFNPYGGLLPAHQFRPLSVYSIPSDDHSSHRENDTMITMFDGDHVRRQSVGSIYEASPCVRVEKNGRVQKRKHATFKEALPGRRLAFDDVAAYESPTKARIVEKPSIASTSSYQFGGERMIRAKQGLLARQSLEESCLSADGEDLTTSIRPQTVFTRPPPTARSRSSTCTSSSGGDTPPLSISDGSSQSEGSMSSIDLGRVNAILANATHPVTSHANARARARARGSGHRRRISQAHMSRASVYETIEEEMSSYSSSPSPVKLPSPAKRPNCAPERQPVFVVDPEVAMESMWDDERGITTLRRYYALRDEADHTVSESKVVWPDTQFSVFALQSFHPPSHPAGMQALLAHSLQNYGPLPSELRPRRIRSRTQSRPSPYPQPRLVKASLSPDEPRPTLVDTTHSFATSHPLQQVSVNPNVPTAAPALDNLKPMSPFMPELNDSKRDSLFGQAPAMRPRVASNARRTALGWAKRSTGKSAAENKENIGQGMMMTPGESLRLNRPRPRGRPTPASQRPIRV